MKHTQYILKLFFIVIFILNQILLCAQEKKSSICISGLAIHYQNYEKNNLIGPCEGYYENEISPGIECLYIQQLFKGIKFGAGINYLYARNSSYINAPIRFRFQELSFPLLLKYQIINGRNSIWSINAGTYPGTILTVSKGYKPSLGPWNHTRNCEGVEGYSSDSNFIDLYFDLEYAVKLKQNRAASIHPFIKYRVNKTWLSTHQKEAQYGIKLSYSFNI